MCFCSPRGTADGQLAPPRAAQVPAIEMPLPRQRGGNAQPEARTSAQATASPNSNGHMAIGLAAARANATARAGPRPELAYAGEFIALLDMPIKQTRVAGILEALQDINMYGNTRQHERGQ